MVAVWLFWLLVCATWLFLRQHQASPPKAIVPTRDTRADIARRQRRRRLPRSGCSKLGSAFSHFRPADGPKYEGDYMPTESSSEDEKVHDCLLSLRMMIRRRRVAQFFKGLQAWDVCLAHHGEREGCSILASQALS